MPFISRVKEGRPRAGALVRHSFEARGGYQEIAAWSDRGPENWGCTRWFDDDTQKRDERGALLYWLDAQCEEVPEDDIEIVEVEDADVDDPVVIRVVGPLTSETFPRPNTPGACEAALRQAITTAMRLSFDRSRDSSETLAEIGALLGRALGMTDGEITAIADEVAAREWEAAS